MLAVADAGHAQFTDTVTLSSATGLVVVGASHTQTVGTVVITQQHTISVTGADHSQTADSVTLAQTYSLSVSGSSHTHTADALGLVQAHDITVASAFHEQSADSPAPAAHLVVDNVLHEVSSTVATVVIAGYSMLYSITVPMRGTSLYNFAQVGNSAVLAPMHGTSKEVV